MFLDVRVDLCLQEIREDTHTDVSAKVVQDDSSLHCIHSKKTEIKLSMSQDFCILHLQSLKHTSSVHFYQFRQEALRLIHIRQFLYDGLQTYPTDVRFSVKLPSLLLRERLNRVPLVLTRKRNTFFLHRCFNCTVMWSCTSSRFIIDGLNLIGNQLPLDKPWVSVTSSKG